MYRQNKRKVGNEKELLAGKFLEEKGYEILQYNYFARHGEIDIVAKKDGYLVFVEVKYRKNCYNGLPEEAIDYKKICHITKAAQYYMLQHGYGEDTPCRFDAVVILGDVCRVIENAFEAMG